MTYVEISVSNGPGTLLFHHVVATKDLYETDFAGFDDFAVQTLTEQEALAWKDMHGGWIAV
jgi:hypothetical protein